MGEKTGVDHGNFCARGHPAIPYLGLSGSSCWQNEQHVDSSIRPIRVGYEVMTCLQSQVYTLL
jgi:hypothetical protein